MPRQQDDSIFRRFTMPPSRSDNRLRYLEFPVGLRPQTDPTADVQENLGFGYTVAAQPYNRIFASVGFHFVRLEWQPDNAITPFTNPTVKVRAFDLTQSLNFWVGRVVFFSVGFGLGVMDSLVADGGGNFSHAFIPYIPIRTGATMNFGDKFFVGLHVVTMPYFGEAPTTGNSRLNLGIGWSY